MAKRRTSRAIEKAKRREERRLSKEQSMVRPSGNSQYARKRAYCAKNGVWGWQVSEPKPWRVGPVSKVA